MTMERRGGVVCSKLSRVREGSFEDGPGRLC
jgi:hypothetical protein